jgi:hypothetical protein
MTNSECKKFYAACSKVWVEKYSKLESKIAYNRYLQIPTERGYAVHYELWINKDNNIKVCLHFESKNNEKLNKGRYEICSKHLSALTKPAIKGGTLDQGPHGKSKIWCQITIKKPLTDSFAEDVKWTVDMLHLMKKTFDETVNKLPPRL